MAGRWLLVPVLAAAGFAALPEAGLACAQPTLRSESPDGRHVLTVCRGRMPFAMPGQGGDAPGVVVLRDAATGRIAGAVSVGTLAEIGHPAQWTPTAAEIPLVAEIPFPPQDRRPVARWTEDRLWRLRNLLWLLPRSETFR
jgi:hypothetical protein